MKNYQDALLPLYAVETVSEDAVLANFAEDFDASIEAIETGNLNDAPFYEKGTDKQTPGIKLKYIRRENGERKGKGRYFANRVHTSNQRLPIDAELLRKYRDNILADAKDGLISAIQKMIAKGKAQHFTPTLDSMGV